MISRNYGGVELGYFFKRNFSLSTRNSRITTTRREIPATASPTFTRPFLSPLLPFLLLFPAKQTRNPSSFSPFLRKETSSTPIAPLDELLLIYRVPVLRLKLRVFFFFFFLLTQWSRIEKIFSASFSLPRMNVSIVFRAHVQLWGIPSYFVSFLRFSSRVPSLPSIRPVPPCFMTLFSTIAVEWAGFILLRLHLYSEKENYSSNFFE